MVDSISDRGPDDEGFYFPQQIGLGFRRLSIIDLSGGTSLFSNEDATVWIVFNGEIYNVKELRENLLPKGHVFRTKTDTEVIVHLYEEFGGACVERLCGMFAFAIWDQRQRTIRIYLSIVSVKILPVSRLLQCNRSDDVLSRMRYVDTKTWLPDDLLIKADEITTANSIELRVPLVDHKVLEFAAALPTNFKVHGSETSPLRSAPSRIFTANVIAER